MQLDKYQSFLLFSLENSIKSCFNALNYIKEPSSDPRVRAIQNEPIGEYITAQETIQTLKKTIEDCQSTLNNLKEINNDPVMNAILDKPTGQYLTALEILQLIKNNS